MINWQFQSLIPDPLAAQKTAKATLKSTEAAAQIAAALDLPIADLD